MAAFERGQDLLPPKLIVEIGGGIAACITGYTAATNALSMKLGQDGEKQYGARTAHDCGHGESVRPADR